jgi:hypothetical protein
MKEHGSAEHASVFRYRGARASIAVHEEELMGERMPEKN